MNGLKRRVGILENTLKRRVVLAQIIKKVGETYCLNGESFPTLEAVNRAASAREDAHGGIGIYINLAGKN